MKKAAKIFLYVIGSIVVLLLLVFLWINSNWGQNVIRKQAVSFLEKKLKTEVKVDELNLSLPYWLELKGVLVRDLNKDTLASIGRLRVDISMLKLIRNEIEIENLILEDAYANLYRNAPDTTFNFDFIAASFSSEAPNEPEPKKDTTTTIDLDVEQLHFKNIRFNFLDYSGGTQFKIALDTLGLKGKKTDINTLTFHVEDILIAGVRSSVILDTSYLPPSTDTATESTPLTIIADKLNLNQVNFLLNDKQQPVQQEGIDYLHMDITEVALNAENAYYTLDSTSGIINQLAAKEKSGVDLQEFKTKFAYHTKGAFLKDLYLKTANSVLQNHLEISYPSIESLSEHLELLKLNIDLDNSVVGIKDVLIFAPDLKSQDIFRDHSTDQFKFASDIKGNLDALSINELYLSGLEGTVVELNGKLNGLPEQDDIFYDLNIPLIRSTKKDLMSFIPKETQENIDLPNQFELTGKIQGSVLDYDPDIKLVSTDGNATVKGYLHMSEGSGKEKYQLYVTTDRLNAGKILKQDSTIGRITAAIKAQGQSFDINTMRANVDGKIRAVNALGYNYRNIDLKGKIASKVADLKLNAKDPNATLLLDATADLSKEQPAIRGSLLVDTANLNALKLIESHFAFRSNIYFDVPALDPDYPNGNIFITQTGVDAKEQRYFIDTMRIIAKSTPDSGQNISLDAIFLQATVSGNIPLTQTGNFIQQYVNKYYPIASDSTLNIDSNLQNYSLNLDARIIDRPLLHSILPKLTTLNPIDIKARIADTGLLVNVDVPNLNYNGMLVDSGKVRIHNTPENDIEYAITLNSFSQNSLQLWYPSITGMVTTDKITSDILIKDIEKTDRYGIFASIAIDSNKQTIKLEKDLLLNYNEWNVSPSNKIVLDEKGLYVDSFKLSYNDGAINIQSEENTGEAPLDVSINNFYIANITEILQQDTLIANGLLNSELKIYKPTTEPRATGELTVENLSVMADTVGNLDVLLKDASSSEVATTITLKGRGNDVAIEGSYYAPPRGGNSFDMNVAINALDMESAEGFAMNELRNSSGKITGNIKITGTPQAPLMDGELKTDSVKTTVVMLGAPFTLPNERIKISTDLIELDNFTIVDENGNKGEISGEVDITKFASPKLDLFVKANKWQVLNSTKQENELFYGKVLLSSEMQVTGTPTQPTVDGVLTIHDSTDFTIVIPESDPGIEEREGVVEFVDKSAPEGYQIAIDSTPKLGLTTAANLNLNVAIEKNAVFNVIIDQASGDLLRVKGEANINTQVNPDGTIGLAGVYTLNDGAYELNYSLVKRRFDIQEGSEIKFAGDPLEAEVDITAAYTANIPPYELVQNEIEEQNANYYKQRLPFSVVLKLTGEIMKPEVNFDITLPKEKNYRANSEVVANVQGKLSQLRNNPSEMNKQVFAALILNKFLASDPFESLGGTSAEYVARQSASRFISAQLNRLAEEFVKGLEINLDLQSTEDYTTGEKRNRTDLNVSATKRLFSDRLSVTVGNNFELEGAEEGNNSNSSYIPGNLAADYQLTKDGRYLVRIFRRRDNINVIDGIAVETGVSFVITLDYDNFSELFKKKKEEEQEENTNTDEVKGTY